MNSRLQKKIAIDVAWFMGVLLVGGVALGGTIKKLHSQREAVDAQRSALSLKETRLTDETSARERLVDLTVATERLEEADSMVAHESLRISAISRIAEASNMRIVSLRSGAARPTADRAVEAERHQLVAVGEFRDLAGFIDALQSARGSVAIDAVKISLAGAAETSPTSRGSRSRRVREPEPEAVDAGPEDHLLKVSLEVIWLGAAAYFDAIRGEEES